MYKTEIAPIASKIVIIQCLLFQFFLTISITNKSKSYSTIKIIWAIKLWGSKTWAHEMGSGTTFHQQYIQGEEVIENLCN